MRQSPAHRLGRSTIVVCLASVNSLAARIFSVVDVWDGLSNDRPYRKAWPEEQVREDIREQAGKHFDPRVAEVFLELDIPHA